MNLSGRGRAGLSRAGLARIPLRIVLVGTMVLLVLVGLIASGAAVTVTMRAQLIDRVDEQLIAAVEGWVHRPPFGPSPGPAPDELPAPGSAPDDLPVPDAGPGRPSREAPPSAFYVEARTASGATVLSVDEDSDRPEIADGTPIGEPVTVSGTAGGHWRVMLVSSSEGLTIIGLPLEREVEQTITLLIAVSAVVGVVVMLVVGAAGWTLVTRAFRPLDEVREAAGEIAAGDLEKRLPPRPVGTEVGDLTASLNEMVDSLRDALETARASEERTRRFAADAGHELRTPLTSIRGFAELHRMGAMPDSAVALDRIENESLRMSQIVEDLLTLAQLDAERPLDRAPIDMAELVSDAVRAARATAPDRQIDLNLRAVPVVTGDAGRLRRVVTNLVVNAVRHTPEETNVWVVVDHRGSEAVLTVRDNGPGMKPEDATRAFERFHRADDSRTRADGGGSGLGLSIVDEIVRAHGGTVELETAPGAGATFTVKLPAE